MVPAVRIVVTGGSGFIGRQLAERLLAAGHQLHLLGRAPKKGLPASAEFSPWDPLAGTPPKTVIEGSDAIIHLAGEPVGQRWTEERLLGAREPRLRAGVPREALRLVWPRPDEPMAVARALDDLRAQCDGAPGHAGAECHA